MISQSHTQVILPVDITMDRYNISTIKSRIDNPFIISDAPSTLSTQSAQPPPFEPQYINSFAPNTNPFSNNKSYGVHTFNNKYNESSTSSSPFKTYHSSFVSEYENKSREEKTISLPSLPSFTSDIEIVSEFLNLDELECKVNYGARINSKKMKGKRNSKSKRKSKRKNDVILSQSQSSISLSSDPCSIEIGSEFLNCEEMECKVNCDGRINGKNMSKKRNNKCKRKSKSKNGAIKDEYPATTFNNTHSSIISYDNEDEEIIYSNILTPSLHKDDGSIYGIYSSSECSLPPSLPTYVASIEIGSSILNSDQMEHKKRKSKSKSKRKKKSITPVVRGLISDIIEYKCNNVNINRKKDSINGKRLCLSVRSSSFGNDDDLKASEIIYNNNNNNDMININS
eukprot:369461_1